MTPAMAQLRARTAHAHAGVDAAFSAFDLGNETQYCAFLRAHARALPVAETIIATTDGLPPTRLRAPLLAADLAALKQSMPPPMIFTGHGHGGQAWGILYVVEGSRLGGRVLERRVGVGLPNAYLATGHEPGEWRRFGTAVDLEAGRHGGGWLDQAVLGAEMCFEMYLRASCISA